MAARYHVNEKGEPGVCRAQHACPFGSVEEHHDSPTDARKAYEAKHTSAVGEPLQKAPDGDLQKELAATEHFAEWLDAELHMVTSNLHLAQVHADNVQDAYDRAANRVDKPPTGTPTETDVRAMQQASRDLMLATQRRVGLANRQKELEESIEATRHRVGTLTRMMHPAPQQTLTEPFDLSNVQRIARASTAHNSGSTVGESREEEGAVVLRMSSWPRAMEAARGFKARGWVTEFTGDHRGGELIRVHNPATSNLTFKNARELTWHAGEQTYSIEASEFGPLPDSGFIFVSQRDGNAVRMKLRGDVRDREQDVLYWEYEPEDPAHAWSVTIYND